MDQHQNLANDKLNELLILVKVNEVGFINAAKHTVLEDYKVYFDKKVFAYTEFVSELEDELIFLDIFNEKLYRCPNFFRKKWNIFKWHYDNANDKSILENTVEAENKLSAEYRSTLMLELKSSTSTLLTLQQDYIQLNLMNYKTLIK